MAIGWGSDARTVILSALSTFAGYQPRLLLYSGTRPTSPGGALSGNVLLANIQFSGSISSAISSGSMSVAGISSTATTSASGTCQWARLVKADGTTHVADFDVGLSGSGADITLSSLTIYAGQSVSSGVSGGQLLCG